MEEVASLVACSKSKRDTRTVAWQLYDSVLFQKSWAAATAVGTPFVMSAKHGLVAATERLDPYDETLRNASADTKRQWATALLRELPAQYETLVLFGGRDYVDPIKEVVDSRDVYDPYQYTSGNGEQMRAADIIASRGYETHHAKSPTAFQYVINAVCDE